MTVFEDNNHITIGCIEEREITDGPLAGYTENFNRIYYDNREILPDDLIRVRDSWKGMWLPGHFVKYSDGEVYAWVGHPNEVQSWRYCRIDR